MVDALTYAVRSVHILAGVTWIGGLVYAGFVVGRGLMDAPPAVRAQAMARIGPRGFRLLTWSGAVTIVFGVANQLLIAQKVQPPPGWHMVLGIAFLLSLAMMGLAGAVVGPALKKMAALPPPPAGAPPGPPPPEALRLQKRLMVSSIAGILMGAVSVLLMVYATKLRVY
ncbi:MAG TPA: DUF4149 domain-containing protein [Candidatus Thermoplasmatota archaeon]|nr:DUF4149 domain-containing protein [Candidatus Thermoplasmatota archaeon]